MTSPNVGTRAPVAEYPILKRAAIRSPVNPMDRSTIVSIFPVKIDEIKHTIFPGRFVIEPGTYEVPAILVVGSSSWWKESDPDQPLLEVPQGSTQVADSVVIDYSNGLYCCDMGEKRPGLFWIPGGLGLEKGPDGLPSGDVDQVDIVKARQELKESYQHLIDLALQKQRNWYEELVKQADAMWARSDHNPRCISGFMRIAADDLGLDKDWARDAVTMLKEKCPACGELRDANFPICQFCHTIVDMDTYKELGLEQAG